MHADFPLTITEMTANTAVSSLMDASLSAVGQQCNSPSNDK